MRRLFVIIAVGVTVAACGGLGGATDDGGATTTTGPDQSVDSEGDEPIGEPGTVGSVPEPRPPIDGNVDEEVSIASADLRIMESYPIQVMLDVSGEKPTPCHEVFWTVSDDGAVIEIEMISQIASDQRCAQVIEPFMVAVPLGSWAEESRQVRLNGEDVGSFDS